MKKTVLTNLIALPLIGMAMAGSALAADTSPAPMKSAKADDFAIGKRASPAGGEGRNAGKARKFVKNC